VRIDGSGNLVVSDSTANVLDALNRVNGTAAFTGVNVGTTSAPQLVILASEGTAGLTLGTPVYTLAARDFAVTQGRLPAQRARRSPPPLRATSRQPSRPPARPCRT